MLVKSLISPNMRFGACATAQVGVASHGVAGGGGWPQKFMGG